MVSLKVLASAFKNLSGHRWSAFLSVFGIALGITSVNVVGALGKGTQWELAQTMQLLGSNILTVVPVRLKNTDRRKLKVGDVETLTPDDAEAIQSASTKIKRVVPIQAKPMVVKFKDRVVNAAVIGTTPEYRELKGIRLNEGTFFSYDDNRKMKKYVVLGSQIAKKLFLEEYPINARVRINQFIFQVIGVIEKRGMDIGGSDDDVQAFIPIKTSARRLFNIDYFHTIMVQVHDESQMESIARLIETVLWDRHKVRQKNEQDFLIKNQNDLLTAERKSREELSGLLYGIAGFIIIVGGFGILAVMLISIKERTEEVGLRCAVGANKTDIFLQFLSETVVLCVVGGCSGILLGWVSLHGISIWWKWPVITDAGLIWLPLAVSLFIGVLFGIYPAIRAAELHPIDALRSEK